MSRKIISILVVLTIITSVVVILPTTTVAQASPVYLENFDAMTPNAPPTGWNVSGLKGTATANVVAENGRGNVLEYNADDAGTGVTTESYIQGQSWTAVSGIYTMQFDFKIHSNDARGVQLNLGGIGGYSISMSITGSSVYVDYREFVSSGVATTSIVKSSPAKDVWNTIEIVLDTNKQIADIYYKGNGESVFTKTSSGVRFRNKVCTTINTIRLTSAGGNNNPGLRHVSFDNFSVNEGGTVNPNYFYEDFSTFPLNTTTKWNALPYTPAGSEATKAASLTGVANGGLNNSNFAEYRSITGDTSASFYTKPSASPVQIGWASTFEFDFKMFSDNANSQGIQLSMNGSKQGPCMNIMAPSGGGTTYNVQATCNSDGTATYPNIATGLLKDTWYRLKVVIDPTNSTYDFFVNGTQTATDILWRYPTSGAKYMQYINFAPSGYGTNGPLRHIGIGNMRWYYESDFSTYYSTDFENLPVGTSLSNINGWANITIPAESRFSLMNTVDKGRVAELYTKQSTPAPRLNIAQASLVGKPNAQSGMAAAISVANTIETEFMFEEDTKYGFQFITLGSNTNTNQQFGICMNMEVDLNRIGITEVADGQTITTTNTAPTTAYYQITNVAFVKGLWNKLTLVVRPPEDLTSTEFDKYTGRYDIYLNGVLLRANNKFRGWANGIYQVQCTPLSASTTDVRHFKFATLNILKGARIPTAYEITPSFETNEDYDEYSAGVLPTGWQMVGAEDNDNFSAMGDGTAKLFAQNSGFRATYSFASRAYGTTNICLRLKAPTKTTKIDFRNFDGTITPISLFIDADGKIRTAAATIGKLPNLTEWADLQLKVNLISQKYILIINNKTVSPEISVDNSGAVSIMYMDITAQKSDCTMYIDNFMVNSAQQKYYLLYQDFEDGTIDTAASGWTFDPIAGSNWSYNVNQENSNKYVSLYAENSNPTQNYAKFTIPDAAAASLTMQFDFRLENDNEKGVQFSILDSSSNHSACLTIYGNTITAVREEDGQTLNEVITDTLQKDVWYNFRIVLNSETKKFDAYLNNIMVKEGFSFRRDAIDYKYINIIATGTAGEYGIRHISFDNMWLYNDFKGLNIKPIKIVGADGNELQSITQGDTVKAVLSVQNNDGQPFDAIAIIALLDSNYAVENTAISEIKTFAQSPDWQTAEAILNIGADIENKAIKGFAWDSISCMKPLTSPATFDNILAE